MGVQPPLEEGELEPPCVPCIACMERNAVIVSLFCGHLSLCLSCLAIYEEGGIETALFAGKGLFTFLEFIIKFYFCFFLCVFPKKKNNDNNNKIKSIQKIQL